MTQDDIIRIAREAGFDPDTPVKGTDEILAWEGKHECVDVSESLKRFAVLVAAEKEQQMIRDGWRKCAENQRTTQFCGLLEEVMKAEREACARMVDHTYGKAIRARGKA